jgi:predicted O-methyltransferase YrrM
MLLQSLARLPARLLERVRRQSIPHQPPPDNDSESARLKALATIPCNASLLGILPSAYLRGIFAFPRFRTVWEKDRSALELLALPEMTGGVNPGDQRAIHYLVQALQPRSVLEIGTHIGCSTVNFALAMRGSAQPSTASHLLTVDLGDVNDRSTQPWLQHGAHCSPKEMCQRIGACDLVTFQQADSLDFLRRCQDKFDLIFLDGLHDADQVYQEIPLERLRRGGFILLHDYFPDLRPLWSNDSVIGGPWLAVQRLIGEGVPLVALPLGKLPWPTKLKSNVTSLALLVGIP